jgi:hypothetical protein
MYANTTGFFNTAVGAFALTGNTTGANNTAIGNYALFANSTGIDNTAVGSSAGGAGDASTAVGEEALENDYGVANTALGAQALQYNQGGSSNTACGVDALYTNTAGNNNTATGAGALMFNEAGSNNCAFGSNSLAGSTNNSAAFGYQALASYDSEFDAQNNVAVGCQALFANTRGSTNAAVGYQALHNNTTAANNTATGAQALFSNTTGLDNAAQGYQALYSNTTGNYNMADGQGALYSNTTGGNNTASGQNALHSNTTGSNNIALGSNAGIQLTTGSNNIEIFHRGVAGEANTIRIGKQGTQTATFIAGISGASVPGGVGVIVDSSGHLGTVVSSQRFKDAIKPMDKASEAILALQPVTFHYKKELDPKAIPQFGLVAEDVEKINPDLVARDDEGKPYTARYEAVNAMLLNEFLKQHKKVEQLESRVAQQQKDFQAAIASLKEAVTAQLNEQAVQIKKVTARFELSKSASQTVVNDQ